MWSFQAASPRVVFSPLGPGLWPEPLLWQLNPGPALRGLFLRRKVFEQAQVYVLCLCKVVSYFQQASCLEDEACLVKPILRPLHPLSFPSGCS